MTAILQVFGTFLLWLYKFCNSYALALIVFTLLTKLVLFPLSYKGKKGMMQMNTMQGETARLQKQYGNNKAKYNEEVQKLYQREGVNPMSGCLWSFLPLPILMGLYYIIRRPMLYMMCLTEDQITAAIKAVNTLGTYSLSGNVAYQEMQVSGLMYGHADVLTAVQNAVGSGIDKLEIINFNCLGLDLSQIPKLKFWEGGITWSSLGLFLIPILVTVLNLAYTKLSQRTNNFNKTQKGSGNPTADQTTKVMMFVMPLMYLWFGFIMPAGMCVYMAFNAIFMAIQEVICARMLRGKYAEMEEARQKRIGEEKAKEKQRKEEIAARRAAEAEERKKNAGKRKPSQKQKKAAAPKESRVGMRTYARGRAYDPSRYAVTPYHDPNGVVDEAAIEEALARNGELEPEEVSGEGTVVEALDTVTAPEESMVQAEISEVVEPSEAEKTAPLEASEPELEEAKSADELFAEIRGETEEKKEEE